MIDEGKSEIEGQTPGDVPSAVVMELSPEAVEESMDIILESIAETDITPANAPIFGRRYLQYTIKGIEHILKESPEKLPGLEKSLKVLKDTLDEAGQGNYENMARFLRAEKERNAITLKDPESVRKNTRWVKLGQIADTLTSTTSAQTSPQS